MNAGLPPVDENKDANQSAAQHSAAASMQQHHSSVPAVASNPTTTTTMQPPRVLSWPAELPLLSVAKAVASEPFAQEVPNTDESRESLDACTNMGSSVSQASPTIDSREHTVGNGRQTDDLTSTQQPQGVPGAVGHKEHPRWMTVSGQVIPPLSMLLKHAIALDKRLTTKQDIADKHQQSSNMSRKYNGYHTRALHADSAGDG